MTILPLILAGANSEIYSGVTKLALPTARPTTLRPPIIPHTDVANACHSAPTRNSTSAISITFFRPSASAKRPLGRLANRAKSEVEEVIRDLSNVVRGREESDVPTDTRVEEMTPVLENAVSTYW